MFLESTFRVILKKWQKWSKMGVWNQSFNAEKPLFVSKMKIELTLTKLLLTKTEKNPIFGPLFSRKIRVLYFFNVQRVVVQKCNFFFGKWKMTKKWPPFSKNKVKMSSWGICSGRSKKVTSDLKKVVQKWSKMAFSGFSTWFQYFHISSRT